MKRESDREREKLKVKERKYIRSGLWLCWSSSFTNLVFYKHKIDINLVFVKYKIGSNLCLENTKSIFQIYFSWQIFSKIILKYALFYKNSLIWIPDWETFFQIVLEQNDTGSIWHIVMPLGIQEFK